MEARDQLSPTRFLVAGVCLFLPVLILPASLSFSFDSLPKAVFLYLAAALFLLFPGLFARYVGTLLQTAAGKLFLMFVMIATISLLVSTWFSIDPELSFFGTRWRHFGALSQISVLALGIAAAGCFSKSRPALTFSLRMFSLGGLLAALYALFQFFGFDPVLDPASTPWPRRCKSPGRRPAWDILAIWQGSKPWFSSWRWRCGKESNGVPGVSF